MDYNVGPTYGGTGTGFKEARASIAGAAVVTDAHAHFFEAVRMGFAGTGPGAFSAVSATGGVAPGTALGTSGNPFVLWNPPNSGVLASILVVRAEYVGGTEGAGVFWLTGAVSQTVKPSAGTQTTPSSNLIGSLSTPRCQVWTGATLLNTPVALQPVFQITAAASAYVAFKELVDGEYVVEPGAVFGVQEIGAAGTSPLFAFGISWEEVPALA